MKADCGFQDNYSVVVASGNMFALLTVNPICSGLSFTVKADIYFTVYQSCTVVLT